MKINIKSDQYLSQITMYIDNEEGFKKRRQQFVQNIRKQNRQEIFSKKRNIIQPEIQISQKSQNQLKIVDKRFATQIQHFLNCSFRQQDLNYLYDCIISDDIIRRHQGVIGIRKILSTIQKSPFQTFINLGSIPVLIQMVKQTQYFQLQLEAAWTLANIVAGSQNQCNEIVNQGGIFVFITLLQSTNTEIIEQAIWAIGNIASDNTFHRNQLINNGALIELIKIVNENINVSKIVKHGAWALSNLCRGNPLPKYSNIKDAIPFLCHLVANDLIVDKQTIAEVCWAISYHTNSNISKIQTLIQFNLISKIVLFLNDPYLSLVVPCIRIIGNVTTGTILQTDSILDFGGLDKLQSILFHSKQVVRRQACWVISNIAAGSKSQAQKVIQNKKLIQKIVQLFQIDTNQVKRQICYIFCNLSNSIQPQYMYIFIRQSSLVYIYLNNLTSDDSKLIEISLQCMFIILQVGQKIRGKQRNPLVIDLINLNAIDQLEKLQFHQSDMVYTNVSKLLQAYFEVKDSLEIQYS